MLEIRNSFLKNLKLALGIKRATRNMSFCTVIKKQETTKTTNYNFFACPKNLKDITSRNDSIGIESSYRLYLDRSISLNKNQDNFFSVLHLLESDAINAPEAQNMYQSL